MIPAPSGTSLAAVLNAYKPSFVWDAYRAGRALGNGTGGMVEFTVNDLDSVVAPSVSVWKDGPGRFEVVDALTYPEEAIGPAGDFSDGVISNYWSGSWAYTNLGLSVSTPTTAAMLGQIASTPADILSGGPDPDVTYVDTTEVQDSVVERSSSLSATYGRVFQILVKSEEGHSPETRVSVGMNSTAGTRTTIPGNTWYRELPGNRGWYAILYWVANNATTTNYVTMSFAQGTGRWLVSSPMMYNQYSTFTNITRAPVPRLTTSTSRGQYQVYTTNAEFSIPVSGWIAGSLVLPDRSVSNGHVDYSGAAGYGFGGIFSWISGTYRIRMFMSSTSDRPVIQLDNGGTSFAYLAFPVDWEDFASFGFVVNWGLENGTEYANLYVNGVKEDSESGTLDWYPQTLASSVVYLGTNGVASSAAADCWVSHLAMGRQPLNRAQARMLSSAMYNFVRGGR